MTVALPGFVFPQGARHQQVTGKMKLFLPNRAKLVPKSVNTIVMINIYNQYVGLADDQLVKDLDEAVNAGYVYSIDPEDFVSLRNGNFPLTSTSMAEGRFNQQGSAAFYTASGECCARTEVPASEDRLLFSVADRSIEVFDLAKFALDYGYGSSFVQPREDRGWETCQSVSNHLTETHGLSGILYQSRACYEQNVSGYCCVILPASGDSIHSGFFQPVELSSPSSAQVETFDYSYTANSGTSSSTSAEKTISGRVETEGVDSDVVEVREGPVR